MTRTMRVNVTKTKTKINMSRGTMTELCELRIELVRRGKAGGCPDLRFRVPNTVSFISTGRD